MTKLSELLSNDNINKIIGLAKDFGCINIRLRCQPPVDESMPMTERDRKLLYAFKDACALVVGCDSSGEGCLIGALETLLTEEFQAEFIVQEEGVHISFDKINALCTDLRDTARIEELYEKKINAIDIRPPDDDKYSKAARARTMNFVREILDEKKGVFIPRHIKTPDELKAQEIEFNKMMMDSLAKYKSKNNVTATPPSIMQDNLASKKRTTDIDEVVDNMKKKAKINPDDEIGHSPTSKKIEQQMHEQPSSTTQENASLSRGSYFSKNSNGHHSSSSQATSSSENKPTNDDTSSNKP